MEGLINELREFAHVLEFAAKHRAAKRYNSKVKSREIQYGDLVLKEVAIPAQHGKLQPN